MIINDTVTRHFNGRFIFLSHLKPKLVALYKCHICWKAVKVFLLESLPDGIWIQDPLNDQSHTGFMITVLSTLNLFQIKYLCVKGGPVELPL